MLAQYTKVGDFITTAFLDEGGQGQVYAAQYVYDPSKVRALKLIRIIGANDPDIADRTKKEVEIHKGINHETIVRLYGYFRYGDYCVYEMDLVDGVSLRKLKGSGISISEAIRIIIKATIPLGVLHTQKPPITHRDAKLQNFMLRPNGTVVLLDFGLAHREGDERITQAQYRNGTPIIMSPERFSANTFDPRSDIFSLAVMLYELLTGKSPFDGSLDQIQLQIMYVDPKPPRQLNPDISESLNAIVMKGLAKRPEDRYQTVDDFRAALEAELAPVKPAPIPIVKPKQSVWSFALAAGAAGLVVAGSALTCGMALERRLAKVELISPKPLYLYNAPTACVVQLPQAAPVKRKPLPKPPKPTVRKKRSTGG